jgi:sugar lactone lactonase YvrE
MKRLALGFAAALMFTAGCNNSSVAPSLPVVPTPTPPSNSGGSQNSVRITEYPTTDTLLFGLTIASDGNVYVSTTVGVDIFTPGTGIIHPALASVIRPQTWPVIPNSSPTGAITSLSATVTALGSEQTEPATPFLATYTIATAAWTHAFGPAGDLFEDVVQSPDGTPWVTADRPTPNGLLGYIFTTKAGCTSPVLGDALRSITLGADNFIWFASDPHLNPNTPSQIFRLDPSNGQVTNTYTLGEGSVVADMSPGPDGALWFADSGLNEIDRLATDGTITHHAVPTANSGLFGIATGCDGAIWFTERGANKIGRITTSGTINEYAVPTANAGLGEIAGCLGNALYFTETHAVGKIVKN